MNSKPQVVRPSSSLLDRISSSGNDGGVSASNSLLRIPDTRSSGAKITRRQHVRRMSILRTQIARDLTNLMGTRRMADQETFRDLTLVQQSVLNYGIPDLSGLTASSVNTDHLQRELLTTIRRYEPRLHPQSVAVKCRIVGATRSDVEVQIDGLFGPSDAMESFEMTVSISLNGGSLNSAA